MSRRLAAWSVIVVAFVGLIALAAAGAEEAGDQAPTLSAMGATFDGEVVQDADDEDAAVAVLDVSGAIVNGRGAPDGSTTGSDDLVAALEAIEDDGDFDGVVLELDTPGGAVLASAEVNDAVAKLRRSGTPVVAWMRDAAASGGYYIAAAADRIVAHPSTITGSIGVILEYPNVQGLSEKVGVRTVVIKSGKLKDIGSPFRDLTPEERQVLQAMIDEAYDDFVEVVVDGRDMSQQRVRELADGRVYTGRQARRNGLVDELGGRAEAYDAIAKLAKADDGESLDVVDYAPRVGLFEVLTASGQRTLSIGALADAAVLLLGGGDDSAIRKRALPAAATGSALTSRPLPQLEYRAVL